ncbi:MAG: hypothetical protein H7222_17075 [Methylotenera sp.]|nr:hypothetical protein [Oligoflexia bacterium]
MIQNTLISHPVSSARFFRTCAASVLGLAVALGVTALLETSASAVTPFPYTARTRPYSGWSAATQGDTNTTGMAGATVALPSSISAAEANSAGYAMETGSVSAQINKISITDKRLKPDGESISTSQWGLGVSPAPWGYSVTYYSPTTEDGIYSSPNTGNSRRTEVSMKELRFTVARAFLDSRLAVGVSAELDKAVREIGDVSYNAHALSYRLGALYRLPDRYVLGASYAPPLTIGAVGDAQAQSDMPGFNQSVSRPGQLVVGAGWVPNRFFKVGVSLGYIGRTENTALLSDQSATTGATRSWIPRAGASYVLAEYTNLKVEFAGGAYYAMSRIQGQAGRVHVTTGLEVNPYFINLGAGFDLSKDYRNVMLGIGIDIVRTLRTFSIIPADPVPAYEGAFPKASKVVADGLPDAMTQGEKKEFKPASVEDVGKIVKEAPQNVVDKIQGKPTTVEKEVAKQKKKHPKKKKGRNSGVVNFGG